MAQALTVDTAGTTAFDGAVGGTTPLMSVTTDAAGTTDLNGASVTTSGAQAYNDTVVLTHDEVLTSSAGAIAFGSSVDSDSTARNLTLSAGGNISVGGNVGASSALASLSISTAVNATFTGTVTTTTTGGGTGNFSQTAGTGTTAFDGGTLGGTLSVTTGAIAVNTALCRPQGPSR